MPIALSLPDRPRPLRWPSAPLATVIAVLLSAAAPVRAAEALRHTRALGGNDAAVRAVVLLPDSRHLLAGSEDGVIRLWDAKSGQRVRDVATGQKPVRRLALSPDGKRVAAGGTDGIVRVWDVDRNELAGVLEGHGGEILALAYLPTGVLLSSAPDGVRAWDVAKEKVLWRLGNDEVDDAGHVPGSFNISLSADARRAGTTCSGCGAFTAWDLVANRPLRRALGVGGAIDTLTGVLTPDGNTIIHWERTTDRFVLAGHDVATGRPVPLTDLLGNVTHVEFFDKGRRALTHGQGGNRVLDTTDPNPANWRAQHRFATGPNRPSMEVAWAVAPDGQSFVGVTGPPDGPPGPQGGYSTIFVYELPAPPATGATTRPAGPLVGDVTWEAIPVTVRTRDGRSVPLADYGSPTPGERELDRSPPRVVGLTDGLDAAWRPGAILFMRRPGQLEEVEVDAGGLFQNVCWDGRQAWAANARRGLVVLARDGTVTARIGPGDGLPPAGAGLLVHPLGSGRVLVAGADGSLGYPKPGTGFCSVVDLADGKPTVTHVLLEAQLPVTMRERDVFSCFRPEWVAERPAVTPGGPREVWVSHLTDGPNVPPVVLRVDPDKRTWSFLKLVPPKEQRVPILDRPPLFLSATEVLVEAGGYVRASVRDPFTDWASARLAFWRVPYPGVEDQGEGQPLLAVDGRVYLTGGMWYRYDPAAGAAVRLGPGLQPGGRPASRAVPHYVSSLVGLAALSTADGTLYRFGVDPSRPLPGRPADPAALVAGEPVPPDGVVEEEAGTTLFIRGDGAVGVRDGRASFWSYPPPRWRSEVRLLEVRHRAYAGLLGILERRPEERQRLGATAEQVAAIRAAVNVQRPLHTAQELQRLDDLVKPFATAADPGARAAAARPLLDAAADEGRRLVEYHARFVRTVESTLSPKQLAAALYEREVSAATPAGSGR